MPHLANISTAFCMLFITNLLSGCAQTHIHEGPPLFPFELERTEAACEDCVPLANERNSLISQYERLNDELEDAKKHPELTNKRDRIDREQKALSGEIRNGSALLSNCEKEKCKKQIEGEKQQIKVGDDLEYGKDNKSTTPADKTVSKWNLGLGVLYFNYDGLNKPRDESLDRSDPDTVTGFGADDSRLGGELIIRYQAPNSKLYLEGGILGAGGFGASEYFREGMIDIDVMREMDFIGFKAGGGFTTPIIKDKLWFFNAGAGAIATKTTTEFTIDYKFDGHVVESMKSRASRTSGSLYGEIGLNFIPLRGFGGGISLQGFQIGLTDPRFNKDYEAIAWSLGAFARIKF